MSQNYYCSNNGDSSVEPVHFHIPGSFSCMQWDFSLHMNEHTAAYFVGTITKRMDGLEGRLRMYSKSIETQSVLVEFFLQTLRLGEAYFDSILIKLPRSAAKWDGLYITGTNDQFRNSHGLMTFLCGWSQLVITSFLPQVFYRALLFACSMAQSSLFVEHSCKENVDCET